MTAVGAFKLFKVESLSPKARRRYALASGWSAWILPPMVVGLVCLMVWRSSKAFAVEGWPITEGEIVGTSLHRGWSTRGGTTDFECEYAYTVGGRRYTNDRIHYAGSNDRSEEERRAAEYTEGTAVTVRYNPADPGDAVIELGNPIRDLVFGGVLLAVCVGLFFSVRVKARRMLAEAEAQIAAGAGGPADGRSTARERARARRSRRPADPADQETPDDTPPTVWDQS